MCAPTSKLLLKSMPCSIEELAQLIQEVKLIIPRSLNSFGRRRALLEYADPSEAQEALEQLIGLSDKLDKPLRISNFGPRDDSDGSNKPKIAHKSTQASAPDSENNNKKQLGLIDTLYVEGARPADAANDLDEVEISISGANEATATGQPPLKTKKSRKSKQLAMQPFSYVIAVDFEATCWEKQAPPQWREAEIIEFPAVLVNLKTGKIEAEFHKYIMPFESPRLSTYCTELTGIDQKTVDSGVPLQTALMMFHEWLRKELRARNLLLPKMAKSNILGNCAFVTWTDWDFGICLHKECSRKRMRKAPYFNQWIDVRAIYREWYKYRPCNFTDALSHVGLAFEGRAHSGIDDAKNLGALMCKMVRDGALFSITKDLTPYQQLNPNCVL
ncbi:ERI1 exoribonuclease 2 isoform X1 [Drosophila grimshawi]|uniref:ERI1 exoribonuclease 2 isoform X1 n=1 Tax=Drosophila grimshawi TaxID=7222 RepID=UPI000C86EBE8|nr:ERI1 exoribonuclease 2 isoform X1 [Drosophila grimshawi]